MPTVPQSDSSDTRTRLLDAAISEFAEKGFESATVRDICQRAQANLNAVKYYFVDKRGLYVESVKEAHRRQKPEEIIASVDPTVDPAEQLHQFVSGMLRMMLQDDQGGAAFHRLMLGELAEPGEATAEIVQQFIGPRFALLESILTNILGPNVSDEDRRMLSFSVVGECVYYRVASPIIERLLSSEEQASLTETRIAEHICGVILSAASRLTARASTSRDSTTSTRCELP